MLNTTKEAVQGCDGIAAFTHYVQELRVFLQ